MLNLFLVGLAVLCASQALRVQRLLLSALWLAVVSALVALMLYRLGAHEVAVIELSVGAGLVTILFVFAINLTGESFPSARVVVPTVVATTLVLAVVVLLTWFILPVVEPAPAAVASESTFAVVLWQDRALDVLVQIGLIFASVLAVLGLLSETAEPLRAPARQPTGVRAVFPVPHGAVADTTAEPQLEEVHV